MTRLPCVYLAANTAYAQELMFMTEEWAEKIQFTMRWPWVFASGQFSEHEPGPMRWAWCNNSIDISQADYLVLRCPDEPETVMRGALVEVGMAIASHLRIIIVGDHPQLGSWQFHPSVVQQLPSFEEAFNWIVAQGSH